MSSTMVQKTSTELRKVFAAYGLPNQVASDNRPQRKTFLKSDTLDVHLTTHPPVEQQKASFKPLS